MPSTTIKVDVAVRQQLAEVARARGTTMTALLAAIAEQLEVEQRWAEITAAYERYRTDDPTGWDEYLQELTSWEAATGEPDIHAAEEWPELNQ